MNCKPVVGKVTRRSPLILVALLGACGGGGGGVATTPPPVAAPVPAPPPSHPPPPSRPLSGLVEIMTMPATQEFAAFTRGDPLRIRFDAASGTYQVLAPGGDWDTLIDEPQSEPGLALFASQPDLNRGYFSIRTGRGGLGSHLSYDYSNLAEWTLKVPGGDTLAGSIALGAPTPAGGVPTTGTGRYTGVILGEADIVAYSGWGNFDRAPINGEVSLRFDFAAGALAGEIAPRLGCDCDYIAFPALSFADTVFAAGSPTFSGRFATGVSGANAFAGRFTGPQAQELIGEWAFPFMHEGAPHSASGVWVAKRGN